MSRFSEEVEVSLVYFYPKHELKEAYEKAGVRLIFLEIPESYHFGLAISRLVKLIRIEKPDLLISSLYRADQITRIASLITRVPLVGTLVNDSYAPLAWKDKKGLKYKLVYWLDRLTAGIPVHWIANAEALKESHVISLGLDASKISVVYRGRSIPEVLWEREENGDRENGRLENGRIENRRIENGDRENRDRENGDRENGRLENEREENGRLENGDRENGRMENGRMENGRLENGRLENKREENGRIENKRIENGDRENGDRENGRIENGRIENGRIENKRIENKRIENGDRENGDRENKRIENRDREIGESDLALSSSGEIAYRFLSYGRLLERKGFQDAIWAFSIVVQKYPNCTLTIYGEGPYRRQLEDLIAKLGLTNKLFLPGKFGERESERSESEREEINQSPNLPPDSFRSSKSPNLPISNPPNLLLTADCFLFPSWYEGFSGALVEAMMAGIPIIASDIPMNLEAVTDQVNGLIFPVGNPKKLAEHMRFAIENPKQMAEFGAAARVEARERFDIEKIAKEYEGVLCVIARGGVIARK